MTTSEKIKSRGRPSALSVPDLLKGLRAENDKLLALQRRVDDAVAMLRSPDVDGFCLASWQEVGDALGLSKQGAQQRYARKGL